MIDTPRTDAKSFIYYGVNCTERDALKADIADAQWNPVTENPV